MVSYYISDGVIMHTVVTRGVKNKLDWRCLQQSEFRVTGDVNIYVDW